MLSTTPAARIATMHSLAVHPAQNAENREEDHPLVTVYDESFVSPSSRILTPHRGKSLSLVQRILVDRFLASQVGTNPSIARCAQERINSRIEGYFTSNYHHCHNKHVCWSCSTKENTGRLGKALADLLGEHPGRAAMVTTTVGHSSSQQLHEIYTNLESVRRATFRGSSWEKLKKAQGVTGYLRTTEITYSTDNGYHPHDHGVLLLAPDAPEDAEGQIEKWVRDRWTTEARRLLIPVLPERQTVISYTDYRYVTKSNAAKLSTNPNTDRRLLGDIILGAALGDADDYELAQELLVGIRDRQQFRTSNHLLSKD